MNASLKTGAMGSRLMKGGWSSLKNGGKTLLGSADGKGALFKPAANGGTKVRTSSKWLLGGAAGAAVLSPLGPVLAGNAGETVGGLVGGLGGGLFGNAGLVAGSSSFAICCIVIIMAMMVFAN